MPAKPPRTVYLSAAQREDVRATLLAKCLDAYTRPELRARLEELYKLLTDADIDVHLPPAR